MPANAATPQEYIDALPEDRKAVINRLRDVIRQNLPDGFLETISYGMLGYVIPHSRYPAGYHVDPRLPLPFLSIASQKNFVAVYHMGMYMNPVLLDWFTNEYPNHSKTRLDMGKSCIRFKKPDQIPYALIGELATKMTPEAWISLYEKEARK